jgi:hypothetical protein
MDTNTTATMAALPETTTVDLQGLMVRYRVGKDKVRDVYEQPGFPRSVVPGMHRWPLAAIEAWEYHSALAGTVADPVRFNQPAPAPVIITKPAPAKTGPKPASNREAA